MLASGEQEEEDAEEAERRLLEAMDAFADIPTAEGEQAGNTTSDEPKSELLQAASSLAKSSHNQQDAGAAMEVEGGGGVAGKSQDGTMEKLAALQKLHTATAAQEVLAMPRKRWGWCCWTEVAKARALTVSEAIDGMSGTEILGDGCWDLGWNEEEGAEEAERRLLVAMDAFAEESPVAEGEKKGDSAREDEKMPDGDGAGEGEGNGREMSNGEKGAEEKKGGTATEAEADGEERGAGLVVEPRGAEEKTGGKEQEGRRGSSSSADGINGPKESEGGFAREAMGAAIWRECFIDRGAVGQSGPLDADSTDQPAALSAPSWRLALLDRCGPDVLGFATGGFFWKKPSDVPAATRNAAIAAAEGAGCPLLCLEPSLIGRVWPAERVVAGLRVCKQIRRELLVHAGRVLVVKRPDATPDERLVSDLRRLGHLEVALKWRGRIDGLFLVPCLKALVHLDLSGEHI
eukprot:763323-Rhodomonas_salina.1